MRLLICYTKFDVLEAEIAPYYCVLLQSLIEAQVKRQCDVLKGDLMSYLSTVNADPSSPAISASLAWLLQFAAVPDAPSLQSCAHLLKVASVASIWLALASSSDGIQCVRLLSRLCLL